jgi:hypothetical protein
MKMPNVKKCEVEECAYNAGDKCRAFAITVGGPAPCCDTFMDSPDKGGFPEASGNVGACKVQDCRYNDMLGCTAKGITVSRQSCNADCTTYKGRENGGDGCV